MGLRWSEVRILSPRPFLNNQQQVERVAEKLLSTTTLSLQTFIVILKSMSRSHRGRFIAITNNQWSDLRTLASQHGWEPCGTIDPGLGLVELKSFEKTGWAGGYDSPSFQKTTEVDACALSDCLASALQHYVESETILESEFSLLSQEIVSQVKEFCALGSFRILPDSNSMS